MTDALAAELVALGLDAGLTLGFFTGVCVPPTLRIVCVRVAGCLTSTDQRRDRIAAARARAAVRGINRRLVGHEVQTRG